MRVGVRKYASGMTKELLWSAAADINGMFGSEIGPYMEGERSSEQWSTGIGEDY